MRRSALPLPRYVLRKPIKGGWAYFFNVPIMGAHGRLPGAERAARHRLRGGRAARRDRAAAGVRCVANWRRGRQGNRGGCRPGTLDWVFAEYRADRRFTKLDPKTQRNHEVGFASSAATCSRTGDGSARSSLAAINTGGDRCRL